MEEFRRGPGLGDEADPVACLEGKAAGGDVDVVGAALHGADEHTAVHLAQLQELQSVQGAVVRQADLVQLHPALGKGVDLDG